MAAIDGPAGPFMAAKFAVDSPAGPFVGGPSVHGVTDHKASRGQASGP